MKYGLLALFVGSTAFAQQYPFLPVPGFAVKLLYGEMSEMVTTGQRAIPARLQTLGYRFRHPDLEPALRDVLSHS